MKKYDDYTYQESNREKKRHPKGGLSWCRGCDRCLVAEQQKCPVCGYRGGLKRDKKPAPK